MMETMPLLRSAAQHKCELWDKENPDIYREFSALCFDLIDRGVSHWGAKAIFEVLRYNRRMQSNDPEYAINNNMTSYYARKWMQENPMYPDFFETRRSKLDE